jgi:hypothetical protein
MATHLEPMQAASRVASMADKYSQSESWQIAVPVALSAETLTETIASLISHLIVRCERRKKRNLTAAIVPVDYNFKGMSPREMYDMASLLSF